MFSKNEEHERIPTDTHTMIGSTIHIEGSVQSEEDVIIAGKVNGSVHTSKNVTVHEGAHIEADITASDVMIAGQVKGNIHAQGAVTLKRTAQVSGDITAQHIAIESGASLKGQLTTQHDAMATAA